MIDEIRDTLDGATLILIIYVAFMFWVFDGFYILIRLLDFIWIKVSQRFIGRSKIIGFGIIRYI